MIWGWLVVVTAFSLVSGGLGFAVGYPKGAHDGIARLTAALNSRDDKTVGGTFATCTERAGSSDCDRAMPMNVTGTLSLQNPTSCMTINPNTGERTAVACGDTHPQVVTPAAGLKPDDTYDIMKMDMTGYVQCELRPEQRFMLQEIYSYVYWQGHKP